MFRKLARDRRGAVLVEYGLVVAGVALVSAAAISVFGHKTNDLIATSAAILPGAHADDNAPILSAKIIETTQNADGVIVLDAASAAAGGIRLDTNLGLVAPGGTEDDSIIGTLVVEVEEPTP